MIVNKIRQRLISYLKFINTLGLLVQRGANYNLQDEKGNTPLHHAAIVNNYEATIILIGLNINYLVNFFYNYKFLVYKYFSI
jgi:ankyrin repeat protein